MTSRTWISLWRWLKIQLLGMSSCLLNLSKMMSSLVRQLFDGSDNVRIVDNLEQNVKIRKYFCLHADQNGKPVYNGIAVCQICRSDILAETGNTSNSISHFHLKHPTVYVQSNFVTKPSSSKADSHQKGQVSIVTSLSQSQPYDRKSKKRNFLTTVVTYCIVKDGLPLYTVEKEGFKTMLYKFDPCYEFPTRNCIFRVAVPDLYAVIKEQVVKTLSSLFCFYQ